MPAKYYAHSGLSANRKDWQPLANHLSNVARLCTEKASIFGGQDLANCLGLLHDLGKYSTAFQNRLSGDPKPADHSTAGAIVVVDHLRSLYGKQGEQIGKLLAFSIAGHHAGLANGEDEGQQRKTLKQRLAQAFGKDIPALDDVWKQEITLPNQFNIPPFKRIKHANFPMA